MYEIRRKKTKANGCYAILGIVLEAKNYIKTCKMTPQDSKNLMTPALQ